MSIPNIVPRGNDDGETLGTALKQWSNVHTKELTVNGSTLSSLISGKVDTSTYNTKMTSLDGSISELSSGKVAVSNIANNLTTEAEGKVLDARQGKALNDSKADKAKLSMPSDTSVVVALASTYTAPADGYIFFKAYAAASGQWISMNSSAKIGVTNIAANVGWLNSFLPCKKNDVITIGYSTTGNMDLKFIFTQSEV